MWKPLRGLVVTLSCDAAMLVGGQNGATPTYVAAWNGHLECIKVLARYGADVTKAANVRRAAGI